VRARDAEVVADGREARRVVKLLTDRGGWQATLALIQYGNDGLPDRVTQHFSAATRWSYWPGAATLPPMASKLCDDPERTSRAFGNRMCELRQREGVSQDNLAREADIHPTSIGRLERGGREPKLTTILRLADGLGVEPGELLNRLD